MKDNYVYHWMAPIPTESAPETPRAAAADDPRPVPVFCLGSTPGQPCGDYATPERARLQWFKTDRGSVCPKCWRQLNRPGAPIEPRAWGER